jgi:hypothetical protein
MITPPISIININIFTNRALIHKRTSLLHFYTKTTLYNIIAAHLPLKLQILLPFQFRPSHRPSPSTASSSPSPYASSTLCTLYPLHPRPSGGGRRRASPGWVRVMGRNLGNLLPLPFITLILLYLLPYSVTSTSPNPNTCRGLLLWRLRRSACALSIFPIP